MASVNIKYLMEYATNKKVTGQLVMVPKQVGCVFRHLSALAVLISSLGPLRHTWQ